MLVDVGKMLMTEQLPVAAVTVKGLLGFQSGSSAPPPPGMGGGAALFSSTRPGKFDRTGVPPSVHGANGLADTAENSNSSVNFPPMKTVLQYAVGDGPAPSLAPTAPHSAVFNAVHIDVPPG
jgi:hypothetical protein